jgi:hypothetical protein
VEDVSEGGVCLRVHTPLVVGDVYELLVTDGLRFFTQELRAQVMWVSRNLAGLRWVDLTHPQQLWLSRRFADWPGRSRIVVPRRPRAKREAYAAYDTRVVTVLIRRIVGFGPRIRVRRVAISQW